MVSHVNHTAIIKGSNIKLTEIINRRQFAFYVKDVYCVAEISTEVRPALSYGADGAAAPGLATRGGLGVVSDTGKYETLFLELLIRINSIDLFV